MSRSVIARCTIASASTAIALLVAVPTGSADGWMPYHPRGVQMRFIVVAEREGAFAFVAPWGETMIARPGDAIVQDVNNPKDTYRIQKYAFACTYEISDRPKA